MLLFGKGRQLQRSLPGFSETLTVLRSIHTRANFMAAFIDLEGRAADELGRNKMWILGARMVVVDTERLCDTARA